MMRWGFLFLILCSLYFKSYCEKIEPVVLVHGGVGEIASDKFPSKLEGVKLAAKLGYAALLSTGSVINAVETAVRSLEDDRMFNAGYGSVLNMMQEVEMDASIMVGSSLEAGGVTIVQNIANPIRLARFVMERTPHILLGAKGAEIFAQFMNFTMLSHGALVTAYAMEVLQKNLHEGAGVGCVAVDENGHVAAAASTGGLNGKMVGRCSSSSQIGAGMYADDNFGAVSATGHDESISKYGLSRKIATAMGNGNAFEAINDCIEDFTSRFDKGVGAIALSKTGTIGLNFTTPQMPWAYQKGEDIYFGIERNQNETEKV